MKGLKYISFLLLLSILILIGHNLVPHHHHVASIDHPSSHECPVEDHDHHDEEGQDCHAFNDLNFVKYNASSLPAPADVSWVFMSKDQAPLIEADFAALYLLQPRLKPPAVSDKATGTRSMRGPPVQA